MLYGHIATICSPPGVSRNKARLKPLEARREAEAKAANRLGQTVEVRRLLYRARTLPSERLRAAARSSGRDPQNTTPRGRRAAGRKKAGKEADKKARRVADRKARREAGTGGRRALPEWDDNVGPDPWRVHGG
jgi:hypothetical protein